MLKYLNHVMNYIEENIGEQLNIRDLSKLVYMSDNQFRRLFLLLADMTLSEYIRRRRMSLAALELQKSKVKVIDVSLKYGYSSPDAFSRAFQKYQGILPSQVKGRNETLRIFPKMTFRLTIEGGKDMEYRIVEKEAFSIIGVKKVMSLKDDVLTPDYGQLMVELEPEFKTFEELSTSEPEGVIHATVHFSETEDGTESFDHYVGAAVSRNTKVSSYDHLGVPPKTWAVFSVEGDWDEVEEQWGRIYSEWLPTSDYSLTDGPEILASQNNKSNIWIPVVKNQGQSVESILRNGSRTFKD